MRHCSCCLFYFSLEEQRAILMKPELPDSYRQAKLMFKMKITLESALTLKIQQFLEL